MSEPLDPAIGLSAPAARSPRMIAFARGLLGRTVGQGALALADQVLVSGARFATSIFIGRLAGAETLGNYTLGFALVVLLLGVQESLIATPYMIYGNRLAGSARARYAGSALVHYVLLAGLAVLGLLAGAAVVHLSGALSGLVGVLLVMAAMMPFLLLQDICRRMAFAHLHLRMALALDIVVATIQLGGLGVLAWFGMLTAATAYVPLGLATGAAGLSWLRIARRRYRFSRRQVMPAMRRNWRFGRWVFGGSTVSILHAYSVYWILALALGPTQAGLFAGCQTILMFSNPFLLGMSNMLGPRAAQAFAQGGHRRVGQVMRASLLFVGGVMVLFWCAVALLGDWGVRLLYGPEFTGHQRTLVVLGAATLMSSVSVVCSAGLCAIERPWDVFAANMVGLFLMLTTVAALVLPLQLLGVAVGLALGNAAGGSVALWLLYRKVAGTAREGGAA